MSDRHIQTKLTGAECVIAALIVKFGPVVELSIDEILKASVTTIKITSTVDGFHYEAESSGDEGPRNP